MMTQTWVACLRLIERTCTSLPVLALGVAATIAGCAEPQPPIKDEVVLVYPPPPEQPRFYYERTIFGSNDVVQETSSDRLRRFATGESARGSGMAKPFDVAVFEGRVFVSDTVSRRVDVFDIPRGRYYEIGTTGLGRLTKPLGLALDRAGHLYVSDGTAKRVLVYDLEGNYLTSIGKFEDFDRPSAVAVNHDGSRIYIVDTGGVDSANHRIRVFDASGQHLADIGTRGGKPSEFNLPLDATVGPEGRLYVLDTGNFRVQVIGADWQFEMEFGKSGRFPGQFSHPKGIAVSDDGKIYVSDTSFGLFQIFNSDGQILMAVGERNEIGGPGRFILPAGIATDVDGRIYVVDQFFRKVDVFRPAEVPAEWPFGQPFGATTVSSN